MFGKCAALYREKMAGILRAIGIGGKKSASSALTCAAEIQNLDLTGVIATTNALSAQLVRLNAAAPPAAPPPAGGAGPAPPSAASSAVAIGPAASGALAGRPSSGPAGAGNPFAAAGAGNPFAAAAAPLSSASSSAAAGTGAPAPGGSARRSAMRKAAADPLLTVVPMVPGSAAGAGAASSIAALSAAASPLLTVVPAASGAAAPAAGAAATNLSNAIIKQRIASFQAGYKPIGSNSTPLIPKSSKLKSYGTASPAAAAANINAELNPFVEESMRGGARKHRATKKHRRAAHRKTQSRSHH